MRTFDDYCGPTAAREDAELRSFAVENHVEHAPVDAHGGGVRRTRHFHVEGLDEFPIGVAELYVEASPRKLGHLGHVLVPLDLNEIAHFGAADPTATALPRRGG